MSEIIEKVQVGANLYEIVDPVTATLICDNVETTFYASKTYTKGEYIRINDSLYKATSNIASGQQMIEGVNITETNVGDELSQLNNDLSKHTFNVVRNLDANTEYTAENDGYLSFSSPTDIGDSYYTNVYLNNILVSSATSNSSYGNVRNTVFVKKGMTIKFTSNGTGSLGSYYPLS